MQMRLEPRLLSQVLVLVEAMVAVRPHCCRSLPAKMVSRVIKGNIKKYPEGLEMQMRLEPPICCSCRSWWWSYIVVVVIMVPVNND
jgi:hypothetical protein